MGRNTANELDPGAYKPGSLREPTHPMSNPVSVGDDLVELRPVGWFIPADGSGTYQQVAKQHEGEPDLVPLYGPEAASQLAAVTKWKDELLRCEKEQRLLREAAEAQLKAAREALTLMFDAYEGVYNCVDKAGKHYRDEEAVSADIAARAALNPKAPS